jgi:hypothetical protein
MAVAIFNWRIGMHSMFRTASEVLGLQSRAAHLCASELSCALFFNCSSMSSALLAFEIPCIFTATGGGVQHKEVSVYFGLRIQEVTSRSASHTDLTCKTSESLISSEARALSRIGS